MYPNSSDGALQVNKGATYMTESKNKVEDTNKIQEDMVKKTSQTVHKVQIHIDENQAKRANKQEQNLNCSTMFVDSEEEMDDKNKKNTSPLINAKIENIECKILIDSGCKITCISKEFYDKIYKENSNILKIPVTGVKLVGATGGKSRNVRFQAYLDMEINQTKFNLVALVVENLIHSVIIGTDWLYQQEGKIDFSQEILQIKNNRIPFTETNELGTEQDKILVGEININSENNINTNYKPIEENLNLPEPITEYQHMVTDKPGKTNIHTHKIDLTDKQPFKPRSYPVPLCHKEKVKRKIEKMTKWGIIRSETPILAETGKHPDEEIKKRISFPDNKDCGKLNLQLFIRKKLLSKTQKRQFKHYKNKKFTKFTQRQLGWLKSNRRKKKMFLLHEGPYRIKRNVQQ